MAPSFLQNELLYSQPLIQGLHDLAPRSSFSIFPPKIPFIHTVRSLPELQRGHNYTLNFPTFMNFPPRLAFIFSVSPVLLKNHPSQPS